MSLTRLELRSKYLGISVYISGGRGIAHGSRFMYLELCDGRKLRVFDSCGSKKTVAVENVKLQQVFDCEGHELTWRFSSTGWLEVCVDKVWRTVCPWLKPADGRKQATDDDDEDEDDLEGLEGMTDD